MIHHQVHQINLCYFNSKCKLYLMCYVNVDRSMKKINVNAEKLHSNIIQIFYCVIFPHTTFVILICKGVTSIKLTLLILNLSLDELTASPVSILASTAVIFLQGKKCPCFVFNHKRCSHWTNFGRSFILPEMFNHPL